MKILSKFLILVSTLSLQAMAINKVVYGGDDRVNYKDAPLRYQRLADSTVAMVRSSLLKKSGTKYKFKGSLFAKKMFGDYFENGRICSDERFVDQKTLPDCSGFLIGSDTIVTAGHCVNTSKSCQNKSWIFGYTNSVASRGEISSRNVFSCQKVIKKSVSHLDYAIIQLDREVVGRVPLKMSKSPVSIGDSLFVIGHPNGLPIKIAGNGKVISKSKRSFKTNLDTFAGNSGSAVFLENTDEVVGILTKGALDYTKVGSCYRVNSCDSLPSGHECQGERVSPISKIKLLK